LPTIRVDIRRRVPDDKVRMVWNRIYPDTPMPCIEAYVMKPKEYFKAAWEAENDPQTRQNIMDEYGRYVPLSTRAGFVAKAPNLRGYIIVRKSTSKVSLEDVLDHEMRHIFSRMKQEADSSSCVGSNPQ